nr:helix-turn-helix transcriptional regulator [Spirochaeta isovalerica]
MTLKDEQTAYDLKKAMDRSINHFYTTSFGSIHPALVKMEKKGLVSIREEIKQGRSRKVYSIEEEGRKVFSLWLDKEMEPVKIRESSLVHIFFFGLLERESRKRIIESYLEEIEQTKKVLEALKKDYEGKDIPDRFREVAEYQMRTLDFGIDHSSFMEEWFSRFLEGEKGE